MFEPDEIQRATPEALEILANVINRLWQHACLTIANYEKQTHNCGPQARTSLCVPSLHCKVHKIM